MDTRQTILVTVAFLLIGALSVWWYFGFTLEFMRFFASEPGVVDEISPPESDTDTNANRMVSCAPATQNVKVGQSTTLTATGGAGLYVWYAPEGNPPNTEDASYRSGGNGSPLSVTYASAGTKKVTVSSPRLPNDPDHPVVDYVACTVIVTP